MQSGGQTGAGQSFWMVESAFPSMVNGFEGFRSWPAVAMAATASAIAKKIFFIVNSFPSWGLRFESASKMLPKLLVNEKELSKQILGSSDELKRLIFRK